MNPDVKADVKPVVKPAGWFGLAIIVAAIAFSARTFITNLTPYVTFGQARSTPGQVQVMGSLDKGSVHNGARDLSFTIISLEGDRMPIRFTQAAPANFSLATQVTAIGKYDGRNFEADSLLVKCPSKYQGTETKQRSYGSNGA